ncbi:LysR family transcriptional regulator [Salipiger mucosus]|uniref:LysR family transcriptional regulator n=1 Tax=Salipiger mucosus TaxID=263378 RepID=UPI0018DD33E1|nr:LysR family transcriptional regulator [Salipiger mucosus]
MTRAPMVEQDITASLKVRHMSLIVALADRGTTHQAADALNMTQSTASKMLRDVEEIFGATLFERHPRGLTPTPLGEFVVSNVRAQLSRLQRFSDEFHARRAGGYGTLTVGAITGAAPDFVARSVAEIKRKRPQLLLSLHGETSDGILEQLEAGRIDLAVGRFSAERHRHIFAFEPLAEERLTVVARTGHPLAGAATRLADLVDCSWALQPPSNPSRQVLDAAFDAEGLRRPTDSVECSSILLILHLVQVSDSVALLPEPVVQAHRRAGLFTKLPIRPEIKLGGFGLVTRRKEPLGGAALEFRDILRARAGL